MNERMRALREDRDFSQREISAYLGIDRSLYAKYERGERVIPAFVIHKLALYYADYLLGLSDDPKPHNRKDLSKLDHI